MSTGQYLPSLFFPRSKAWVGGLFFFLACQPTKINCLLSAAFHLSSIYHAEKPAPTKPETATAEGDSNLFFLATGRTVFWLAGEVTWPIIAKKPLKWRHLGRSEGTGWDRENKINEGDSKTPRKAREKKSCLCAIKEERWIILLVLDYNILQFLCLAPLISVAIEDSRSVTREFVCVGRGGRIISLNRLPNLCLDKQTPHTTWNMSWGDAIRAEWKPRKGQT